MKTNNFECMDFHSVANFEFFPAGTMMFLHGFEELSEHLLQEGNKAKRRSFKRAVERAAGLKIFEPNPGPFTKKMMDYLGMNYTIHE